MGIDNPSSHGHAIYQRRVNRFFVIIVVAMCLAWALLSAAITPVKLFLMAAVAFSILVMVGGVLILASYGLVALYHWVMAHDSFY
jgi:arginine exporter protein ArgO